MMANINYCRFENTSADVSDCLEALRGKEELSADECRCAKRLFLEILEYMQEVDIVEDFDRKALTELLEGMTVSRREAE